MAANFAFYETFSGEHEKMVFIFIVAGSLVGHIFGSMSVLIRSLKFPFLILGLFASGTVLYLFILKKGKYVTYLQTGFLIVIIGLSFFDLFRLGYRFLTFSNERFLYPDMSVTQFIKNASKSSLSRVYGLTEPELGTYLGVYTIETYNPLYLLRTAELMQALQKFPPHNFSTDNKYFLTTLGENLMYALNFMGAEYIVTAKYENPAIKYFNSPAFQAQLQNVYIDERYSVYKNTTSYPRFGLYYHYSVFKDDKSMLEAISKRKIELSKNVLLEEKLPVNLEEGTGSARLITSNINEQTFKIKTDKPALFYISDAWYPGWEATLNNQPTKIYRANYSLRAVLVPTGEATITFKYAPQSFKIGIIISCISFIALVLLVLEKKKLKT
ncbi:YfhO family protein [Candidatus Roizmanbacteria bacterium]|nr:YfhO family protein [Candidatus Roizmanbacteria bacterium]